MSISWRGPPCGDGASSRAVKFRAGKEVPSMRNRLDSGRALRRAWTGSRLKGSLRVPARVATLGQGKHQGRRDQLVVTITVRPARFRVRSTPQIEDQAEARASTRAVADPDRAVMRFHDLIHDGKTKPRA